MKEHSTKKSLKASGLALMLCIAMLMGTTFGWFTDSITNSGNKIQAGNLDIGATAYDIGTGGTSVTISGINNNGAVTFEATGENLETSTTPIISEELFEPGKSNAKLLEVQNKGSLAAKVKLSFDVTDGGLQKALWFDFVQVDEKGQATGSFTKRPMGELTALAEGVEVPLASNQSVRFVMIYGMSEDAGNEYQGKTFTADVTIHAKQNTVEKDGFGSDQYDKNAQYDGYASTQEEFKDLLAQAEPGDKIAVTGNFELDHIGERPDGTYDNYVVTEDVTIDLKGHTITMVKGTQQNALALAENGIKLKGGTLKIKDSNTSYALFVTAGAQNIVLEDMTIIGGMQVIGSSSATLKNVTIEATNYYDVYLEYHSQVIVESGQYINKEGNPHFYTATPTDKIIVNGGVFKGGVPTHNGNGTFVNNVK